MRTSRDFLQFYSIPIVLLIGILLAVGFTGYYTATAQTREGKTVAGNWPKDFTLSFSQYMDCTGDVITVTDEGKALLADNGLWLQVLDASGTEVLQVQKPAGTPGSYQPYALLDLYQYGAGDYSVFISRLSSEKGAYTYLIGFPLHISKVVLYVDNARFYSGKALIFAIAVLTALLVVTMTIYSYRTFRSAERRRRQDETAKEEWLVNITHDLKTPLAPIRGYGELLSEEGAPSPQDTRRYGEMILKNALYAEQLVDDLKLTYQLQSNMLPLHREAQNITRFVREIVIDILNAPEYQGRSIAFAAEKEEQRCSFDPKLLRRALENVLINALKHNQPDTEIAVSIQCNPDAVITITDNGSGMTAQELDNLFRRYYRGTNTETKTEGSGLGMAIAKQIVEAHGGWIQAVSAPGAGTEVTIRLSGMI